MTIEQLMIENQEILRRMKNEEWDTKKLIAQKAMSRKFNTKKFIKELKGEK